jgi:hypothetical protein
LEVVVLQIPKTTTSNVLPSVEKALQKLKDKDTPKNTSGTIIGAEASCRNFNYSINSSIIGRIVVETDLLQKLGSKEITKAQLFQIVESDFGLVSVLLEGASSSKATVRYGCGSVLMNLSEKHPAKLYSYMDKFIGLLDSKHRILTWNAMAIIANLTSVDLDCKFDAIFDKYYDFLSNEYMVTVANVVANSAKIAQAKPYLSDRIAAELLKVQNLKTTPHLTEECKLVIAEQTIKTFSSYFGKIENPEPVLAFVQKQLNSPRVSLKKEAQRFLKNLG